MNAIVEIDKAGRIVIPKKMRDAMGLRAGTRLRLERSGDLLVMEPPVEESRMEMRDGLWVMVGENPVTVEDMNQVLRQGYEERQKRIMEGSGLE
jgi:AbrB family looped-hinge helix DNA binding protein